MDSAIKVDWSIIHADCIAFLAQLAPGQASIVFADPPYNLGLDYGAGHDDQLPRRQYLDWCATWMNLAAQLLEPDGSFWVLISEEWADEFGVMLRKTGLHRRKWIIWYESFGTNCKSNFTRSSRHLFWMVKDPRNFKFHREAVSRPSARQTKYNDKRANPNGRIWDDIWGINPPIPRVCGTFKERIPRFPTQLPLKFCTTIVECVSDPGDTVVDLFSGSGTMTEATYRRGRRGFGIERNEEWVDASRARLRAVEAGTRPDYSIISNGKPNGHPQADPT